MAEASLKLGGDWATKEGSLLGFNDQNGNYKPIPFDFTRATTATRVNRDGLIEEVQSGVPRIDFTDSAGSLLLEPQRTNSLLQSNKFDTTWVTNTATIQGGQVGVGNSNDAWLLSRTGTNGRIYQTSTSSGTQTLSIYAKSNTNNWLFLVIGSSETAYYDLENGVVGTTSSSNIAKIEPIGSNGWYRCSLTFTHTNPQVRIQPALADNNVTGSGSIYIQHAQLEAGSYPTSIIKTSGSAVTRNADVCNNAQTTFNDSEGVLYAEIAGNADSTSKVITLGDGTSNNRIQIFYHSSNELMGNVVSGGVGQTTGFDYTGDIEVFNKVALKYKGNDCSFWVNGTEIATDVSATMPSGLDTLMFDNGTGASDFYGNIKEIRVYNTALTDTELEELTTI